nr:MAG TPA: hypothetical protein [Inoviridae sp.]
MQAVFDYLISLFSQVYGLMNKTVFTVYGYSVSLFWLILSITFMCFLFTVLLPFVARGNSEYQYHKATSERNDKNVKR